MAYNMKRLVELLWSNSSGAELEQTPSLAPTSTKVLIGTIQ